jgi:hypothetical protein
VNYGALISRSFWIAWRNRHLWVLAVLAGGAGSNAPANMSFNLPGGMGGNGQSASQENAERIGRLAGEWISQHLWLIGIAAIAILCLMFLFAIVSIVCQGGLCAATAEIGLGNRSSFGFAFQSGVRLFWRNLGIAFLGLLILLLFLSIIGAAAWAFLAPVIQEQRRPGAGAIVGFAFLALGILFLTIPVAIIWGVITTLAQRAIAVEDAGLLQSFGRAGRLARANLGQLVLVWLIEVGVSILIGLVATIALILIMLPMAAVGFAIYFGGGSQVGPVLIGFGALAALVAFVAMLVLGGAAGAFHWTYWTLAYLRWTDRLDQAMAPIDPLAMADEHPTIVH